jgi:hypothetical protein
MDCNYERIISSILLDLGSPRTAAQSTGADKTPALRGLKRYNPKNFNLKYRLNTKRGIDPSKTNFE